MTENQKKYILDKYNMIADGDQWTSGNESDVYGWDAIPPEVIQDLKKHLSLDYEIPSN